MASRLLSLIYGLTLHQLYMDYRSGTDGDFINIETFVWQAIFPAFHHPDLNEAQQAENDAIVEQAREACLEAVALPHKEVIIAYDQKLRRMAGFVILDRGPSTYPEIVWLIVSRSYWGKGVADQLMRKGIGWLGHHKPIQLGVHYYLERAIAFFEKYGFENTGEPAGDHLIPRILMIREAGPLPEVATTPAEQLSIPIEKDSAEKVVHNPLEPADEPPPAPNAQVELFPPPPATATARPELVEQEPIPIVETPPVDEESSDDEQPTAVSPEMAGPVKVDSSEKATDSIFAEEDDFATSVGQNNNSPEQEAPADPPPPADTPRSRYQDIEFEIDYGVETPSPEPPPPPAGIAFEFAFEEADPDAATDEESAEELELPDLEPEPEQPPQDPPPAAEATPEAPPVSLTDLRRGFQDHFMQMVTDLFGNRAAADYWQELQISGFREIVDSSLRQLLEQGKAPEEQLGKLSGDLTEYFIVETAAALHGQLFPQKLLRHQTRTAAGNDGLFTMVNDYLDFRSENERVDTDFITISPKRLRNATRNFLLAAPGERIFCLVDQSILGNLKNGFAFTDAALYWKTLLQPNHAAYYNELTSVRLEQGALSINGHFFDTGSKKLNYKVALLLKKLGRINGSN